MWKSKVKPLEAWAEVSVADHGPGHAQARTGHHPRQQAAGKQPRHYAFYGPATLVQALPSHSQVSASCRSSSVAPP